MIVHLLATGSLRQMSITTAPPTDDLYYLYRSIGILCPSPREAGSAARLDDWVHLHPSPAPMQVLARCPDCFDRLDRLSEPIDARGPVAGWAR